MRTWDSLLIGEANPLRGLTSGLRKVTLDEAAFIAALEADTIRRGQTTLVEPSVEFLRRADCLEIGARTLRIMALNEERSRAFIEELRVLNG